MVCFHCGEDAVIWGCDFTFEDYDILDKNGIVHELHCTNCGAEIVYYCEEDDDEADAGTED